MNPQAIIESATKDGLHLSAANDGHLHYRGKQDVVTRWLPTLKAHKSEILAALTAANDPPIGFDGGLEREQAEHEAWRILLRDGTLLTAYYTPPKSRTQVLAAVPDVADLEPLPAAEPTGELSRRDESDLRAWLALIGETDEAMICAVLEQCRADSEARAYYLRLARAKP